MTTFEAIKGRTSYRGKYKNEPVPREDLKRIMEAGLVAPSGCNTQTTSLIAIDDMEILNKLRGVIEPEFMVSAPAIICVLTQAVPAYKNVCFNIQDYSAAIENMLLAIVALGYQSCWVEGQITDEHKIGKEMAEILNVPDEYDLICFLPVGIADEPLNYVKRKPFDERAWFNGFRK
jgi:nitroreductase